MAMAMAAFSRGEIKKIILARPAVEAGETLRFLPGDLSQKINRIEFIYFSKNDVVRHKLVSNINLD